MRACESMRSGETKFVNKIEPGGPVLVADQFCCDRGNLGIGESGFLGGRHKRTLFDVRVFNPYAPSNRTTSL